MNIKQFKQVSNIGTTIFSGIVEKDDLLPGEFTIVVTHGFDPTDDMNTIVILTDTYDSSASACAFTLVQLEKLITDLGDKADWQGACYEAVVHVLNNYRN